MPELLTMQDLANGHLDVKALGEAANGDENTIVTTRTGNTYPSAERAINIMFGLGGLPAEPFATLAKMQTDGASLADGQLAMVYNETANNGLYVKTAGAWVKSAYDPLGKAMQYIDSKATVNHQLLLDKNLNTVTDAGIYIQATVPSNSVSLNYPVASGGFLQVVKSSQSGFTIQAYFSISDNTVYVRTFASTWSAWGSSKEYLSYVDNNPKFKAKNLTASDNLNNIITSGDYHKIASGDILLTNNYPVQLAGVLSVDAISASAIIQRYSVFSTGAVYVRTKGSTWSTWALQVNSNNLGTEIESKVGSLKKIEWQSLGGSSVSYDAATRTVKIVGFILAAWQNPAGRIRISSLDIPLTGDYDVCFLDLNKLGTVTDITSANYTDYLFVGSYSSAGDLQYRAKLGQVPLFKYDVGMGKAVPCAGFIDFDSGSSGGESDSLSNNLQFTKTAGLLDVYFPQVSGKKINFGFRHYLVPATPVTVADSNSDLWRLYKVFTCNSANVKEIEIVNSGALEFTMTHVENTQAEGVNKDHVGGYHGDELLTKIDFYVDGIRKDANFVQAGTATAKEIQAVQHSVIYYQNTLRPLADHVKVITFKDGVVNVKQKVNFKYEACQLSTAWLAMLPILRTGTNDAQITDRSSRSDDYYLQVDDNTTTAFDFRFTPLKDGSVVKQWLSTGSISSETTVIKTPNFSPTQNIFITNGAGYNKLYVSATDGSVITPHDVPLNTVWEWETEYKIKC